MFKYLKFLTGTALFSVVIVSMFAGGHWMWFGFIFVMLTWTAGDLLIEDTSFHEYHHPGILTAIIESTFFFMVLSVFTLMWITNAQDLLGVGQLIHSVTGYDVLAARETNTIADYYGAGLGLGIIFGGVGVLGGHELIHRTWDPVATFFGRWMFAMTGGFSFEVGHMVTHHPLTGCPEEDPASARRGDNIYYFLTHNTPAQIKDGWRREAERLQKMGTPVFSRHNKLLRGGARVLVVLGVLYAVSGWAAIGVFAVGATLSKLFLEGITYHGHYGQLRVPGHWPEPRHSWNSNAGISSWVLFYIARHAAHHVDANIPFYQLKPSNPDEVPVSHSYFFGSLLAYIPPLYYRLMLPDLLMWDEKFANPEEQALAREKNAVSGLPILMRAASAAG